MRYYILLVALCVALAGCEFGSNEDQPATETVVEVPIPGPDDPTIDPDQQQTDAERPEGIDAHEDAKDETPPGVTPAELKQAQSTPPGVGKPKPVGGAQLLSCRDHFVRNFSDRTSGTKVSMFGYHYTVSSTSSFDAIWNLFNTPSFGASSHYLLGVGGRCERLVPTTKKAWTQGAFNSAMESVEIVCCTSDPPRSWWLDQPIIKNLLLASLTVDRLRARGLPPNLVDPDGCTPKAGFTDHNRLECGNTHTDVGSHFPWDVVAAQVKKIYNAGSTVAVWRALSGGKILEQKRTYLRIVAWERNHPGIVRTAEAQNGSVVLKKVSIPAT